MVFYDISNEDSFKNSRDWIDLIRNSENTIPIILIANKIDLEAKDESLRMISAEKGINFSSCFDVDYMEASSFSTESVTNVFEKLINGKLIKSKSKIIITKEIENNTGKTMKNSSKKSIYLESDKEIKKKKNIDVVNNIKK